MSGCVFWRLCDECDGNVISETQFVVEDDQPSTIHVETSRDVEEEKLAAHGEKGFGV